MLLERFLRIFPRIHTQNYFNGDSTAIASSEDDVSAKAATSDAPLTAGDDAPKKGEEEEEEDVLQASAIVGMTAAQLREELVRRGVEPPKLKSDAMRLLKETLKKNILCMKPLLFCFDCFLLRLPLTLQIHPVFYRFLTCTEMKPIVIQPKDEDAPNDAADAAEEDEEEEETYWLHDADIAKMTVVQLKAELTRRGAAPPRLKADMVKLLRETVQGMNFCLLSFLI